MISRVNFNKKRTSWLLISIVIIATFLTISMISAVSATDLTISSTTPGGLKKAIETVKSGSIIYMENGVYNGTNNRNLKIDKNITIKGKGKNVVIGHQKYSNIFTIGKFDNITQKYIPASATLSLINIKISKFNSDQKVKVDQKKDVIIENYGYFKVNNCTFSDNKIGSQGSIIANNNGSKCKIITSIFTKNIFSISGEGGAAIKNYKVASFTITKSNFTNFKSPAYIEKNPSNTFSDVAISNQGGNILISKCIFQKSVAGCSITNTFNGSINVTSCNFINDGISIYNSPKDSDNAKGTIIISKSNFKNVRTYGTSITNGAIMKLTSSKFTNNNYLRSESITNYGSMSIIKSTFKNNKGIKVGAISNMGSMTITGSTFTSNIAKGNSYSSAKAGAIHSKKSASDCILKISNSKFKNNIAGKTYRAIFNEEYKFINEQGKLIKAKVEFTKKNVKITPKEGIKIKK